MISENSIIWRVKSRESIVRKIKTGMLPKGRRYVINDYVGIRVITKSTLTIPKVIDFLELWSFKIELKDIMHNSTLDIPPRGGYRAYHIDYELKNSDL